MSPLARDTTEITRPDAGCETSLPSGSGVQHVAEALLHGAVVALEIPQAGGTRARGLEAVELAAPLVELAEERLDLVLAAAANGLVVEQSGHAASFSRVGS